MNDLTDIASLIKESRNILILPHLSADGDAIGSCLALYNGLIKIGIKAIVCTEEKIPATFNYLKGTDKVIVYDSLYFPIKVEDFDCAISLDSGDFERLGKRRTLFEKIKRTANIDHHRTNTLFAGLNYVDIKSSATGEIIFDLLNLMDIRFDTEISECIYNAIISDTGAFRFSNTSPRTHEIAAKLLSFGVDNAEISRKVFDTTSLEKIKLISIVASKLEIFAEGKIAIIEINNSDIEQSGASNEDSDGIVNIARNLRGTEVGVLIKDKPEGEVKISLRSNYFVDVSKIATEFGGGGHMRAAGYSVYKPINEAKAEIVNRLEDEFKVNQ